MKKVISLVAVFFFFIVCIQGQELSEKTKAIPVSICELMKNKKKYHKKKVYIEDVVIISAHQTIFMTEEDCDADYELIAVGEDKSFVSPDNFEAATNLLGLVMDYNKSAKRDLYIYTVILRIPIKAEGIFQRVNNGSTYPYQSPYNVFSITNVKEFGKSDLFFAGDLNNSSPLISKDFNVSETKLSEKPF